jgi:hypothetical protein
LYVPYDAGIKKSKFSNQIATLILRNIVRLTPHA